MDNASPSVADLAAMASLHVRSKSAGAAFELSGFNAQTGASPSPVPHQGGGIFGVTPIPKPGGGAGTLMTSPVSVLMLPALNLSVETTPGFGGGDVSMSPGVMNGGEDGEEPMTPFGAPTTAPFGPTPGADGVGWTPPPVDRSRETRKSTGGTRGKAKSGGFRSIMAGVDDMDEDDDWDAHDLGSDDSLRADDDEDAAAAAVFTDNADARTPPSRTHLDRFSVDVDARMSSPVPAHTNANDLNGTAVLSSLFDSGFDSRDAHGGLGSPVPFGGFQSGFQTFDETARLPHTPPRPVKTKSGGANGGGNARLAHAPSLQRFDSLRETKVLVSTSALARCGSGKVRTVPNVYVPGSSAANGSTFSVFGHDDSSRGSMDRGAGSGPGSRADSPVEFRFHDHFDFQRQIGRSPTSEAWLVRSKQSNKPYCVKKVTAKFRTPAERSRYIHEVEAVCFLPPHANVVKYYRAWQEHRHFYAQMELCECGSFGGCLSRLDRANGVLVDEVDVWRMAAQVAAGLAHVHAYGILHLDVKPDNMLLDADGTYKLGDFGVAYVKDKGWELQDGDGGYVAPEVLAMNPGDPGSIPTSAADVFSLGASVHEAACGKRLDQEWRRGVPVTIGELEQGPSGMSQGAEGAEPFVLPLPEGRSAALARLVSDCCRRDPSARPTAAEVAALATAVLRAAGFDA